MSKTRLIPTKNRFEVLFCQLKRFVNKPCNLMIAGGSLLNLLDNEEIQSLNTENWTVYYADERLTENVSDLNFEQSKIFLRHLKSKNQIKPLIYAKDNFNFDPENEYKDLKILVTVGNKDIESITLPKMDLIFLGIGFNDGHICSLFPGQTLNFNNQDLFVIEDSPKLPPKRITVSINYLNKHEKVFFFVKKREMENYFKQPSEKISKYFEFESEIYIDE